MLRRCTYNPNCINFPQPLAFWSFLSLPIYVLLCVCIVTIVTVSDAILQHSVPLLLLLLSHHTEVVVAGVWVPQDEGEPGCTLDEWVTAHFGLDTCNGPNDEMRFQKHFRRGN